VETAFSTTVATLTACFRSAVVIVAELLTSTLIATMAACFSGNGDTTTDVETVVAAPRKSNTSTNKLNEEGRLLSGAHNVASSKLLWLTRPRP